LPLFPAKHARQRNVFSCTAQHFSPTNPLLRRRYHRYPTPANYISVSTALDGCKRPVHLPDALTIEPKRTRGVMPEHRGDLALWNGTCIAQLRRLKTWAFLVQHGVRMKYLAICLLCVASLLSAAGATGLNEPHAVSFDFSGGSPQDGIAPADRALALVLAAAHVALQLRRRQKSLRMPRPLR
jgi:hypothetical protein